ncbi:MAG: copper amine oxidase N-terminal domain-containing protein [Clostridia bacterium]|nr:copper amine oxidase N-terminal domain-containing protein [Clostridia bacterium]MDH7573862.1 copper amine oxidase N-terminal domain-containing protein [Clostridia bacterium]
MRKTRSKAVSILVALTFLLTMVFAFAGPAAAGTTYSVSSAPTVSDTTNQQAGTIYVNMSPLAEYSTALLSLPTGVTLDNVNDVQVATSSSVVANVYPVATTPTGAIKSVRLEVAPSSGIVDTAWVTLAFADVDVDTGYTGDITVTITGLSGQLPDGDVVIATVGPGQVTLAADGMPTLGESGGTVKIKLRESTAGALVTGASLKLKLPAGFEWDDTTLVVKDVTTENSVSTITGTASGRDLTLNVSDTSGKGYYRVEVKVVPTSTAKQGDITVTVLAGTTKNFSPSSLVVAKYGDYGVTVSVDSTPELIAGRYAAKIGTFTIQETLDGSLVAGRAVTMTLPEGAKWVGSSPASAYSSTNGLSLIPSSISKDGRTAKYTVAQGTDTRAGKVTFKDVEVALAVDFAGDLTIEFGGSAGLDEVTATVAKVIAPISASCPDKPAELIIGLADQPAGEILIKESKAGALLYNKRLVVDPGEDVRFDGKPTVTVTEGDLEVKAVEVSGGVLSFTISSDSSEPSTIRISNIKYKVDRTVVYGDVEVAIKGDALDEVNDLDVVGDTNGDGTTDEDDMLFPDNTKAATVVNATVVTPAPTEAAVASTFTVGSTGYTVGGETKTMDVAPFIENGRTYLPVRYAAYAVGVSEDQILWDAATATATFMKGDRVVQFVANTNKMIVNGSAITIDVPIKSVSGRLVVPIRWVGVAFGCTVDWNAETQTVTVTQ